MFVNIDTRFNLSISVISASENRKNVYSGFGTKGSLITFVPAVPKSFRFLEEVMAKAVFLWISPLG